MENEYSNGNGNGLSSHEGESNHSNEDKKHAQIVKKKQVERSAISIGNC